MALENAGLDHLFLDKEELDQIKGMVEALSIIECSSRMLCQRDCNLSEADQVLNSKSMSLFQKVTVMIPFQIFELMIGDLRKLESLFAVRLLGCVEERIAERRLKVASTLLAYLEDPSFLGQDDLILEYASKYQITNLARDIYFRHYHIPKPAAAETGGEGPSTNQERQNSPQENPDEPAVMPSPSKRSRPAPPKKTRSNEWRQKIKDKRAKSAEKPKHSDHTSATLLTSIKNDMKEYERGGERPEKLNQVTSF